MDGISTTIAMPRISQGMYENGKQYKSCGWYRAMCRAVVLSEISKARPKVHVLRGYRAVTHDRRSL